MIRRLITLTIFLGSVLYAGYYLYQAKADYRETKQEYDRLVEKVGRLEVSDSTKIHLAPIKTSEPFHFAWRVFIPEDIKLKRAAKHFSGGSSSSYGSTREGEAIWRVRYRFDHGQSGVYVKGSSGSSTSGFSNEKFIKFLEENWKEFDVQVLAENGTVAIEPDEVTTLLKIEIPEHLHQAAQKAYMNRVRPNFKMRPLVEVTFGELEAFEKAKEKSND